MKLLGFANGSVPVSLPDFPAAGSLEEKYQWLAIVATDYFLRNEASSEVRPVSHGRIEYQPHKTLSPYEINEELSTATIANEAAIRQLIVDRLNKLSFDDRSDALVKFTFGHRAVAQYETHFNQELSRDSRFMRKYFDACWKPVSERFIR